MNLRCGLGRSEVILIYLAKMTMEQANYTGYARSKLGTVVASNRCIRLAGAIRGAGAADVDERSPTSGTGPNYTQRSHSSSEGGIGFLLSLSVIAFDAKDKIANAS